MGCFVPGNDIDAEFHLSTVIGKLHGIGKQVEAYLVKLVIVGPHGQGILKTVCAEYHILLVCIDLEYLSKVPQLRNHIYLSYLKLESIILKLIEVQKLIHKTEHSSDIPLHYIKKPFVLHCHHLRLLELGDRTGNHGQRGSELMGNIGKEAHVHPVHLLLLLFFLLCLEFRILLLLYPCMNLCYNEEYAHKSNKIKDDCPPAEPQRWPDDHTDGILCDHNTLVTVGNTYSEVIFSCRNVRIIGLPVIMGIYPMVIKTFEHVEIVNPLEFAVLDRGKGYAETVLVMIETYFRSIRKSSVNTVVHSRTHKPVVDLQIFEIN